MILFLTSYFLLPASNLFLPTSYVLLPAPVASISAISPLQGLHWSCTGIALQPYIQCNPGGWDGAGCIPFMQPFTHSSCLYSIQEQDIIQLTMSQAKRVRKGIWVKFSVYVSVNNVCTAFGTEGIRLILNSATFAAT